MTRSDWRLPQELDDLCVDVDRFRQRWREKLKVVASARLAVEPNRGIPRELYVFPDNHPQLRRFIRELSALEQRIGNFPVRYQRDNRLWLPSIAVGCTKIRRKAYRATSVRKISEEQARTFLRRQGSELPRGQWLYFVRSVTGNRYVIVAATTAGVQELPVREWNVFGYVDGVPQRSAPAELIEIRPRQTEEEWAEKKGLTLLGTYGKSQLYARVDDSEKARTADPRFVRMNESKYVRLVPGEVNGRARRVPKDDTPYVQLVPATPKIKRSRRR